MSAAEVTPEYVARCFHAHYERLAPDYGYETRPESAVAFDDVPLTNRALMTDVARHVLRDIADRTSTATGCQQCIEVAIRYEQERDAAVACAEKAERERDEALAELRTHLSWGCAWIPEPMTTVDEDGRVWRLEQPMSEDGFDGAGYDTHPPHTVTFFGLRRDGAMERPDRIKRLYRLVPIEADS